MRKDDVLFKGTKDGVLITLNDEQDYEVLKKRLKEKLVASDNFFQGGWVILDVGRRTLTTAQLIELETIINQEHGVHLSRVIRGEDASNGITNEEPPASNTVLPGPIRWGVPVGEQKRLLFDDSDVHQGNTIIVRRTIRSGQRVRFQGSVVILGDVNPGAEVTATGDIVVLGSLRGVAHAGAAGDERAVVAALSLQPTQLRIGSMIARPPDGDQPRPAGPELARVIDGAIVIRPYQQHDQERAG